MVQRPRTRLRVLLSWARPATSAIAMRQSCSRSRPQQRHSNLQMPRRTAPEASILPREEFTKKDAARSFERRRQWRIWFRIRPEPRDRGFSRRDSVIASMFGDRMRGRLSRPQAESDQDSPGSVKTTTKSETSATAPAKSRIKVDGLRKTKSFISDISVIPSYQVRQRAGCVASLFSNSTQIVKNFLRTKVN